MASPEKYRRELGTIVVQDFYGRREYDRRIEVQPTSDSWLISPERTWEEVDSVLEGRLEDLQQAFLDPKRHPIKVGQKYGIERGASGNMARFLAYVELTDEYRNRQERLLKQANAKREEYEVKKTTIRQGPGGKGKKDKLIVDLWRNNYNSQIQTQVEKSEEAKKVQERILRKATIDFFSSSKNYKDLLERLPHLIDDAKKLLSSNESSNNENKVDLLLQSFSNYLAHTQDGELFKRYNYKNKPGLINKLEDTNTLATLLNFTLDAASFNVSGKTKNTLAELGKSYFMFLKRQRVYLSTQGIVDYPVLSFIYDGFTISLNTGKKVFVEKVCKLFDENFADFFAGSIGKKEIQKCVERWHVLALPAYETLGPDPDQLIPDSLELPIPNDLPSSLLDFITSDEYRIVTGISVIYIMARKHNERLPFNKTVSNIRKQIWQDSKFMHVGDPVHRYNLDRVINIIPYSMVFGARGIEIDVNMLAQRVFSNFSGKNMPPAEKRETSKFSEKIKPYNKSKILDQRTKEGLILTFFVEEFIPNLIGDAEKLEEENKVLWEEVLDNPKWFVSPRGDRFRANKDPQIQDYHIDHITFRIDRNHPREHIVEHKIRERDTSFVFWLDSRRNILNSNRQPLLIDPRYKQIYTNIFLKRLYVITSGLLAKETLEIVDGGMGGKVFEYRRAHYRVLTSTSTHPVTMESHGAQVHAREILEDYGIDIFAEIRRRRSLGTLKPNEYLTFVRESTPGVEGRLVLPNDLSYNPELVRIPL